MVSLIKIPPYVEPPYTLVDKLMDGLLSVLFGIWTAYAYITLAAGVIIIVGSLLYTMVYEPLAWVFRFIMSFMM
jgi:hypothetical protein